LSHQFFWSKGAVCCDQVRALLGCPAADPLSPCAPVAFAGGLCADLAASEGAAAAFAAMADGPFVSGGAFVCTAFPADNSPRDTVISGLISFAVSLPLCIVVANCFGLSTATDDQQLHGRTRWMTWPSTYRLLLGRLSWRWSAPGTPPPGRAERLRRLLASWWCSNMYIDAMVAVSDAVQLCVCRPPPPPPRRGVQPADATLLSYDETVEAVLAEFGQDAAAQAHFGAVTTRFKYVGYVLLNLVWGFFAWIVFAYGRLVYNLLGPAASRDFSNSWGIGVAIGQANDASGLVTAALQAVLILTILELLWLHTNTAWLESYVDFASCYASVAAHAGRRRLWDVLLSHKRNFYAVA
jgi:hypothetical protein